MQPPGERHGDQAKFDEPGEIPGQRVGAINLDPMNGQQPVEDAVDDVPTLQIRQAERRRGPDPTLAVRRGRGAIGPR